MKVTKTQAQANRADVGKARAKSLDLLAHAVGAIVLSRACPSDSPLADEILSVCRDNILASLSTTATTGAPAPERNPDAPLA